MKLLLSTFIIICGICSASAQNALFPELARRNTSTSQQPTLTTQTPALGDINLNNARNVQTQNMEAGTSIETEKPEMDTGNLRLVVTSADSIRPTMRNFSYCTAQISLENGTSQTLKSLNVRLTYAPLPVNVSFSGVAKNQSQTQQITLIGEACDGILNQPIMEVQNCQITNMSENECKKRVEFVPFS